GGFLRFGERPEEGMARELREELGVTGRVGRLLLSTARLGERSRLHWVMLFYEISIDREPRIDPDEIAALRWFTRDEIEGLVMDAFLKSAIDATWTELEQVHADR
ncbi:MAG: NUDIX hydrolase, partial [Candidatus Bipolaricaulota bacterium]